jgi:hypothetical protein
MNQAEIEQIFRSLQLDTEEQRLAMRFEPILREQGIPVQVFTTDSTLCQAKLPESHEIA